MENFMEKSPDKNQSVSEPTPELKMVREFFVDALSRFLPETAADALANKPTRDLFQLYKAMINSAPTYESFKTLTENMSAGIDYDSETAREHYREFLAKKTPKELIERQIKENHLEDAESIPLEKLESLHSLREEKNTRMFLGFHVANIEYEEEIPQSKTESVTVVDGKQIIVPRGNAHYSVSENGLYKDVFKRGGKAFLYFVEGSTSDFGKTSENYRTAHQSKGWINTARKIPILFKTKLTPDILASLSISKSE